MIGYTVKIKFKSVEDELKMKKVLQLKQDLFNYLSEFIFNRDKIYNNQFKLHKDTYRDSRKLYPELKSQYIIKTEQDVIAKYKSAKSNKHRLDAPVQSNRLYCQLDKRLCTVRSDFKSIKITTCEKQIELDITLYKKFEQLLLTYKTSSPTIFYRNKQWYLSFSFYNDKEFVENNECLGVDLGLNRLIATSENYIIKGNKYNAVKRRLRYNIKCLQSKKTRSAKRHLRKISHKEYHFSINYCHHIVNHILKTYANTIVLEDLSQIKQKNVNKGTKYNNRISQAPWRMIRFMLSYKASALGKKVEFVKPFYTSREDYRGLPNGKRKGCRYYAADGTVLDADVNAANNIMLRYNKHSVPCSALDGQATVNWPIVIGKQARLQASML